MKSTTPGYYSNPSVHGEHLVFVCEGDLWSATLTGSRARRLTAHRVHAWSPAFSPDGNSIAFASREEGCPEVYVMPAEGGPSQRVTYLGARGCMVYGWTRNNDEVLFGSNHGQPLRHIFYRQWWVPAAGGIPRLNPIGPADRVSVGPEGGMVIGRSIGDPARWKRYRGGRTGDLWIDRDGSGEFRRLLEVNGNLASPLWIGDRIFLISDHEGYGNLYSCTIDGRGLTRHTHHDRFYARNATTDGRRIVYQCGGQIYCYDVDKGQGNCVPIEFHTSQPQKVRRFVPARDYLEDAHLHPQGHSIALNARGKAFTMGNWEKAVCQHGARDGVRYRLTRWLSDGNRVIAVSDEGGEEALEVHSVTVGVAPRRLNGLDLGRALELEPSPCADRVVLTNHRFEVLVVDLLKGTAATIDRSEHERILGVSWSPDGEWIAYGYYGNPSTSHIRLAKVHTGEVIEATKAVYRDANPSFDSEGRYLYFIGYRTFRPVVDRVHFNYGFPRGSKPHLVLLRDNVPDPFDPDPHPLDHRSRPAGEESEATDDGDPVDEGTATTAGDGSTRQGFRVDRNGISDRVLCFPVEEGCYGRIAGVGDRVFWEVYPIEGAKIPSPQDARVKAPEGLLQVYDLKELKKEGLAKKVSDFRLSGDRKTLLYRSGNQLRVVKSTGNPTREEHARPGRKSGWIDLSRPRVSVRAEAEWMQMYREAWRLQRDHFWNPQMGGVDWLAIYEQYLPILARVATREEFSDLLWEMQGELGTSHAYEMGGDRAKPPPYRVGHLGADLEVEDGHWIFRRVLHGDSWERGGDSPLRAPGVRVRAGDKLLTVDGQVVEAHRYPGEFLVHRAREPVVLEIEEANGGGIRAVTVTPLTAEQDAAVRYRDWVERTRQRVHEATSGRIGYLHIPDMGPFGFAEFHRYWVSESDRQGLIVDVRFNGGGNVSGLLLEKLAREQTGWSVRRHGPPRPRPPSARRGPLVAITNEYAGSDGDIFSHSFKLIGLGPLIGKRTWGGVVGIWPRHSLVDRTVTTQAEFAVWFDDVGWGVENYGTDPDIEVEVRPQDWRAGSDPQLEKSIEWILDALEKHSSRTPDFSPPPDRAPPRLPNRQ